VNNIVLAYRAAFNMIVF